MIPNIFETTPFFDIGPQEPSTAGVPGSMALPRTTPSSISDKVIEWVPGEDLQPEPAVQPPVITQTNFPFDRLEQLNDSYMGSPSRVTQAVPEILELTPHDHDWLVEMCKIGCYFQASDCRDH
jgi:hypothetical protein